ncbi:MAG: hypothetical protein R3E66_05880 [bacterium]
MPQLNYSTTAQLTITKLTGSAVVMWTGSFQAAAAAIGDGRPKDLDVARTCNVRLAKSLAFEERDPSNTKGTL